MRVLRYKEEGIFTLNTQPSSLISYGLGKVLASLSAQGWRLSALLIPPSPVWDAGYGCGGMNLPLYQSNHGIIIVDQRLMSN